MAEEEKNQVIERIKRGDAGAFRDFVEEHTRLVFHLVHRLIRNPADHEDICQDVFVSAYQNLKEFRRESKVSTWLAKITYFRCLNYLKKKRAPLFDDQTPESFTFEDLSSGGSDPYTETEQNDRAMLLRKIMDDMPPVYRTIVTLYHLEELSYGEIGQVMELPAGTVKSYLFRARKMLRERLVALTEEENVW